MRSKKPSMAEELRSETQRFFRRFGVLGGDVSPCGTRLPLAHAHALMVLRARGEMSQRELGLELGIDKSNVTRLCTKMVEAGHATQRTSPTDGRARLVSLSDRGGRLANEVDAASRARFEAVLAHLPSDQHRQVIEALRLLVDASANFDHGPRRETP